MVRLKTEDAEPAAPTPMEAAVNKWQKKDGSLNVKGTALKDAVLAAVEEKPDENLSYSDIRNAIREEDDKYAEITNGDIKFIVSVLVKEDKVVDE